MYFISHFSRFASSPSMKFFHILKEADKAILSSVCSLGNKQNFSTFFRDFVEMRKLFHTIKKHILNELFTGSNVRIHIFGK